MSAPDNPLMKAVDALAGTLRQESFPKGDLAELRRLKPDLPPPAFWRLLVKMVPPELRHDDRSERAWAVIIQAMAIMAPDIHAPGRMLGQVMHGLGSTSAETRLWRFLRSRGDQMEDQIRLLARFLASKELRVDWYSLARLILAEDEEQRESVCRNLARSFYFTSAPETPTPANA